MSVSRRAAEMRCAREPWIAGAWFWHFGWCEVGVLDDGYADASGERWVHDDGRANGDDFVAGDGVQEFDAGECDGIDAGEQAEVAAEFAVDCAEAVILGCEAEERDGEEEKDAPEILLRRKVTIQRMKVKMPQSRRAVAMPLAAGALSQPAPRVQSSSENHHQNMA